MQDKKGKAEQQLESLTGLENMKYVFNKTEISRSTEESCAFAWGKSATWPFSFFPKASPMLGFSFRHFVARERYGVLDGDGTEMGRKERRKEGRKEGRMGKRRKEGREEGRKGGRKGRCK